MRVLMIGAGGVALTRPLDWVVKAGYEVWLLGDVDPYETEAPKNYRYFPTVWRKYLEEFTNTYPYEDRMAEEMAEPLRKLVDEFQPDIIHVHAIGWHAYCCALANLSPLVVSAWGFLNHLLQPEREQSKHTDRVSQVFKNTGVLIVETPSLIEKSKALLNPEQRVELIPLGTNPQHFRSGVTKDLPKWRREVLKITEAPTILLSPRGWSRVYNHEQIFTAYAQAYPQFTKPTVLVFSKLGRGGGEEAVAIYESIRKKAEELGLLENLRWMPALPYNFMPTGYNLADVIINYPTNDAFPSTLIEAVACERPVITCDLLAYRGTFIEEFCTLVEPENPTALAEAMIKVVNQPPQEREVHLAQARQVIVEQYDEAILQKRLFQIYEDLASATKVISA
ncbi:MAG: glycosyltransferase family 4 protein [Nostoc sp. GBBB01]|uniref:Glycosyltransferase family 4 protein n=1 Tax=Nostoc punctiforme FACHB-252 TaxID=1357509 RepID=A0ABR8HB72_NOSPU|nr:glycosyltransferase family 4 protein [Nostoc punctiforme]MBD2612993.1 glycosyltransferase family 4 protein [Nostoc punctiforme FACHB-252]MBL1202164.1 glycosyltransferase family 4 protein [Nostoc sp. GBBB01]